MHFNEIKIDGCKIRLIMFLDLVCFKEFAIVNHMVDEIGVQTSVARMFISFFERCKGIP